MKFAENRNLDRSAVAASISFANKMLIDTRAAKDEIDLLLLPRTNFQAVALFGGLILCCCCCCCCCLFVCFVAPRGVTVFFSYFSFLVLSFPSTFCGAKYVF